MKPGEQGQLIPVSSPLNLREIETLVDLVHVARVSEVTVRANGRRVTIRKDPNRPAQPTSQAPVEVVWKPASEPAPERPSASIILTQEALVIAPMVGVFHASEPAVRVGSDIKPGQVVGMIESMRLMNEVTADVGGVVTAIGVEDGMAVEYGQVIFRIDTSGANGDEELGI